MKSFIKFYLLSIFLTLTLNAQETKPSQPEHVIIVLDASGSMWGQINGRAKIDIAKEVIKEVTNNLSPDIRLGLVAYGHRKKGDCSDIELLIPPSPLNKDLFNATVKAIQPKGMTPLTSAVEFAAEKLKYKESRASVILVTDGKETCDRDPCEISAILEKNGLDFTAHVVAFDLNEKDAKSVECVASNTGGLFLKADDTASLKDSLEMAIDDTKEPNKPKIEEKLDPATITAPKQVVQGSEIKLEWTGPNNKTDYISIVPKDAEDETRYVNYTYTRSGSPTKLLALMEIGPAEIRYLAGRSNKVLGRTTIEIIPAKLTLTAPDEIKAGGSVKIDWTGPNNKGDYITIVTKDTEDGKYAKYEYTKKAPTLTVTAPLELGTAEIRYMSGQGAKVLARRPIEITKAEITLSAPDEITAGGSVKVNWTGPDNKGDYITIVNKNTEDGKYAKYDYTNKGPTLTVIAPLELGPAEIRYMAGQGGKVLARRPIEITKAEITLSAADQCTSGQSVKIDWTGPDNKGDYITIVTKDTEDGKYAKYEYTKKGPTLTVIAPLDPGPAEIRYMAGQGGKVLARIPIEITKAKISLSAPDEITSGGSVKITWTGPNNSGDYITIVTKDTEDGKYAKYQYTKSGSPIKVIAPTKLGAAEIRYMSGQGGKVLARQPILILEDKELETKKE
ncbi:MAG: vWA domain-containing protein [Akkermansiaceae bacterium]